MVPLIGDGSEGSSDIVQIVGRKQRNCRNVRWAVSKGTRASCHSVQWFVQVLYGALLCRMAFGSAAASRRFGCVRSTPNAVKV